MSFLFTIIASALLTASTSQASIYVNRMEPLVTDIPAPPQIIKFDSLDIKKAPKILGGSIDLDAIFNKYSSEYGVDKNLLTKIADCESHFHTNSVNGDYAGMFQFSTGTWKGTRAQMGLDQNPDLRFSAEESIKTAAFKISRGGSSAWPACSKA